jgi:hypothetical protein
MKAALLHYLAYEPPGLVMTRYIAPRSLARRISLAAHEHASSHLLVHAGAEARFDVLLSAVHCTEESLVEVEVKPPRFSHHPRLCHRRALLHKAAGTIKLVFERLRCIRQSRWPRTGSECVPHVRPGLE